MIKTILSKMVIGTTAMIISSNLLFAYQLDQNDIPLNTYSISATEVPTNTYRLDFKDVPAKYILGSENMSQEDKFFMRIAEAQRDPDLGFIYETKTHLVIGDVTYKKEYIEKSIQIGDTVITVYDVVVTVVAIAGIATGVLLREKTTVKASAALLWTVVGKWVLRNGKLVFQTVKKGWDEAVDFAKYVKKLVKDTKDLGFTADTKITPTRVVSLKPVKFKKLTEAAQRVKTLKKGDGPNDLLKDIKVSELPKARKNRDLANSKHSETGVKFNSKSYAQFEPDHKFNMGYTNQMNKSMRKTMTKDEIRREHIDMTWDHMFEIARNDSKFLKNLGLKGKEGIRIRNELRLGRIPRSLKRNSKGTFDPIWTPHHSEKNGNIMELVNFDIHRLTGHSGGMSTAWGNL